MKTAACAVLAAFPAGAEQIAPGAIASLPRADVVVLGEVHDNPHHHVNQARAVAALRPVALVFEMLTPDQAARVTDDLRGDAVALGKALGWAGSGWPDFDMYHPIFAAAPQAAVYGAALPRDTVRRAVTEGAATVFGPEAEAWGLAAPLPAAQKAAREANQMEAHCNALPETLLSGLVEAQRLRDAVLARTTAQAVAETGGPVAVITGNGHARLDWGVPAALALGAPAVTVLSVAQFEAVPEGAQPFDLWLVTAPAEREDPCAAFAK
ncbi:putative iron-regulated protein [Rhodovulum imhoffii]|uniref:Putative iron-regulated protein n=2 Tax=Rhodovulum imhoffii TaxID=365340 RepID=A0A2T5BUL4_9RHOB|nr:putative iron-regulated protein [Rhodovulum imhoffii]